jgi:hypothetical protein
MPFGAYGGSAGRVDFGTGTAAGTDWPALF